MAVFEDQLSAAVNQFNEAFGHDYVLRGKQIEVLHEVFEGHDSVAVLGTGYGKSLIYMVNLLSLCFIMPKCTYYRPLDSFNFLS
jgi:superfamily II DNA helicase RecQ